MLRKTADCQGFFRGGYECLVTSIVSQSVSRPFDFAAAGLRATVPSLSMSGSTNIGCCNALTAPSALRSSVPHFSLGAGVACEPPEVLRDVRLPPELAQDEPAPRRDAQHCYPANHYSANRASAAAGLLAPESVRHLLALLPREGWRDCRQEAQPVFPLVG